MVFSILPFINTCVLDVFATMVGLQASPGPGEEQGARPSCYNGITGCISLTGKFSGVVFTNFSDSFARIIAHRILGPDPLGDTDVTDVIGEITNMISGNLKSQMCDRGYNCQLSIPTVMRGEGILVDAKGAPCLVLNRYEFEEVNESLIIQVFARLTE